MLSQLRSLVYWRDTVVSAIISTLVSAIAAFSGAYIGALYAEMSHNKVFRQSLTGSGVGFPSLLFSEASAEKPGLEITFNPPELERIAICEYYSDRQITYFDIMERFLEKYSSCLIPVWRNENFLEIRPNQYSGMLTVTSSHGTPKYWCKCGSEQIK